MHKKTEVGEIQIGMATAEGVALTVLAHLRNGEIHDAIACFAEGFTFKDQGIGLEFKDKERLFEFFRKTRELYPDSSLETDTIFVSGNCMTIEWTLQTTLTEPFYGGLSRRLSIVRTENEKGAYWGDYYDGLPSRRSGLAALFEEWVEL